MSKRVQRPGRLHRRVAGPLILSALLIAACRERGETPSSLEELGLEPPLHVFLVSLDTLRADRLGCYGYSLDTSPFVDRFRRDAVLFRHAVAQAPSTLPSHASILTSLLPQHHGASVADGIAVADEAHTLAEALAAAGYATLAFTGGGQLDPAYGIDQGFDEYRLPKGNQDLRHVTRPALRWLRRNASTPAFLFLHTYQVHAPYRAPEWHYEAIGHRYEGPLPRHISLATIEAINDGSLEVDAEDRVHVARSYDADVHSVDHRFGAFVRGLKENGLYERSLIVLTSDHGEELDEHGWLGWHSHTLYDELLHVPLLIKFPRSAYGGYEVRAQVRGIDIAPTVLDALGLPLPEGWDGTSLLPYLRRPDSPSLPAVGSLDPQSHEIWSYREPGWKLYAGRLFDLAADPHELVDVAAEHPQEAQRLHDALAAALARRSLLEGPSVAPSTRLEEELRALGYVE